MRLLNSSSIRLENFSANQIPAYAILSHTWGEDADEISFADMVSGGGESKAGYIKILHSCKQAADEGIYYIWIDTCCIDKSSSAELSEAINSMYMWYQKAEICYAYLSDVSANVDIETSMSAFDESRWFRRGWTLQELIAPSDLVFFSREWIKVGTKSTLCNVIAEITHVKVGVLTHEADLESTSIAERLSWASNRDTTRTEDMAYCLMGLFNVNMPLLYGEGKKAFIRLQEEIIKYSDDQSIFVWTDPTGSADNYHWLLASSPKYFANWGHIVPYRDWGSSATFSISNKGLQMGLHLSPQKGNLYVAALACLMPPEYEGYIGIYLERDPTAHYRYVRVKSNVLCKIEKRGGIQTVYVQRFASNFGIQGIDMVHIFQLRKGPTQDDGYELIEARSFSDAKILSEDKIPAPVSTSRRWPPDRAPYTFKISKGKGRLAGALLLRRKDGERLVIMLGSATDFRVGFDVAEMGDINDLEELQRLFDPQRPGKNMVLKNHQVRVHVDPQVHNRVQYYMIDIDVEALYPAPNPVEMLKETMHRLQSQSDERPPHSVVTHSRSFWRLKRPAMSPWKNSHPTVPFDM